MYAVDLALPASVAVSNLMVSESFGGGGGGVTVMEVEARQSDCISAVVSRSIERCSPFLCQKGNVDTELRGHANRLSIFDCEDAPEELKFGSRNSSPLSMPRLDSRQIQRKPGKVGRSSSSSCSKRSRMAQMEEVSVNEAEADDAKETTQVGKQKNGLNGKRVDKRNGKVPMKSKYDSLSLKAGLVSFNSAAGGNNFLGTYGLKLDTHDVTKHLDELSVNELLDGSYKCLSFAKDKGKKAAILNQDILRSVRKACSILQLRKPLTHYSSDIDNCYNWKASTCPLSSDSCVTSRTDSDKGDICTTDLSSYNKVQDSSSKHKTPPNLLDFLLKQPKDILDRLALPPCKDLDSLLLDAVKPAVLSKNNSDIRGKPISHRASLPPFPWSHSSGGHCKSNADGIKLSASRSTCQGRWVKIGNTATYLEDRTGFLVDLESLTCDHSLVPLGGLRSGPSESEIALCTSVNFTWCESGSSSSATCSIASQLPPESECCLNCEGDAGYSPRSLVAARTLCDIATHSLKEELHGMIRWPKKPSEKTMKASKSNSNDKSRQIFAAPKSVIVTDHQVRTADEMLPLKKPKLLMNEKREDLGHSNTMRKGPINWSTPRSNRLSSIKTFRDSFAETKPYNAKVVKQSCMMPPPPPSIRVLNMACNSQQKLRKLVSMEWNREGRKQLD